MVEIGKYQIKKGTISQGLTTEIYIFSLFTYNGIHTHNQWLMQEMIILYILYNCEIGQHKSVYIAYDIAFIGRQFKL